MSESAYNTELAAFQSALARLQPVPDGINLARLLFRAGQLSARRSWAWPCATPASVMLAAALGSVLVLRPAPLPTERILTVYVPSPTAPPPQAEPAIFSTGEMPVLPDQLGSGDGEYLRFRREVLAHGLDALPSPPPWPAAAPTDDANTLLDMPRGSREPWLLHLKRSLQSGGPL